MSPANPEDSRLMALVESIDEGESVDWEAAERGAASDEERAAVRELRLVAEIASVCNDPEAAAHSAPHAGAGQPAAPSEPLGQWGPYRLVEQLGRGAFGSVYRAVDNLDREVALKLLSETPDGAVADSKRVLREGRLLARIRHGNVVKVHAADEFDGRVGLSMELIEGFTLEEELHARGVLGAGEATLIGLELCRALAAVHGAGLLHRDVKAQNVMREWGGRIILMDLGAGHETAFIPARPVTTIAGTPLYLAPELYAGRPATPASDIYSVGVLLYHLVTGSYPVDGKDVDEVRAAHESQRRQHLRDVRSDLPASFVQIVERALDRGPERRFQTAGELERALVSLGPMPHPAPVEAETQPLVLPTPPARMTPWKWVTASLVAMLLAAVGVWGAWQMASSAPPPRLPRVEAGDALRLAAPAAANTDGKAYTIDAAFHRVGGGVETRLDNGSRVQLGDHIALTLQASREVFVYVVNEDAAGETFLLFPLPGQALTNPLSAGARHRLPGIVDGEDQDWQVTSAGGDEHFLLFVSPTRLETVEKTLLADLPRATRDHPMASARLSQDVLGRLRGVGGLAPASVGGLSATRGRGRLSQIAAALGAEPERAAGVWVRQLTLENPQSPDR